MRAVSVCLAILALLIGVGPASAQGVQDDINAQIKILNNSMYTMTLVSYDTYLAGTASESLGDPYFTEMPAILAPQGAGTIHWEGPRNSAFEVVYKITANNGKVSFKLMQINDDEPALYGLVCDISSQAKSLIDVQRRGQGGGVDYTFNDFMTVINKGQP